MLTSSTKAPDEHSLSGSYTLGWPADTDRSRNDERFDKFQRTSMTPQRGIDHAVTQLDHSLREAMARQPVITYFAARTFSSAKLAPQPSNIAATSAMPRIK